MIVRHMVKWFWIRSLPETRKSRRYQYWNSFRKSFKLSSGMLLFGSSPPKKMKSHTASDMSSGAMPKGPFCPADKLSAPCRRCANHIVSHVDGTVGQRFDHETFIPRKPAAEAKRTTTSPRAFSNKPRIFKTRSWIMLVHELSSLASCFLDL